MAKPGSGSTPASRRSTTSEKAGSHKTLIAQLKAALLAKDKRIEQLELLKRQLEERLRVHVAAVSPVSGEKADAVSPPSIASNPPATAKPARTIASPGPSEPDWKLPIASEFVRMIAPARGIHRDLWAEPQFNAPLRSQRVLCECTLEVWLKPDSGPNPAHIVVRINGVETHTAQLTFGRLNTVKFPVDIGAETIFEFAIICDYVRPVQPPDKRRVSYVLRSLKFA